MAITTAFTTSAKSEMMQGIHQPGDTYKLVLIKPGHAGNYGAGTTNAGTPGAGAPTGANVGTDEASGTGYASGGIALAAPTFTISGNTALMDFASPAALANATLSAVGGLIVNTSKGNRVLGCFDFGGTITSTNGPFQVTMPASGAGTSVLRIG